MRINLSIKKLQKLTICQKRNLSCQAFIHSLSVDVHKFGLFITAMAKIKLVEILTDLHVQGHVQQYGL